MLLISFCGYRVAMAQSYETGVITASQPDGTTWFKVALKNTYTQPVVIASPLTGYGSHSAGVRVRNVTSTSFEYQLDEFDYTPPEHREETFSYFVIEEGTHTIDGNTWEAGITLGRTDNNTQTIALNGTFGSPPAVLTQLASDQDPVAAIVRVQNVNTTSFRLQLQEEENLDQTRTAADSVHFIAVQPGSGLLGGGAPYEVGITAPAISDLPYTLSFSSTFSQPIALMSVQTKAGGDPFFLRYNSLHGGGVDVWAHEEQSSESETLHDNLESVGYLVIGNVPSHKQLLWVEDFDLPDGTTADNSHTAWTRDVTNLDGSGSFEVLAQKLVTTGTIGEVIWQSEAIPISGYSDVKIAVDMEENSTLEMNDYLQVYYKLDGGPETPLLNGLQSDFDSYNQTTAMINGLNGTQLEIIIKAKTSTVAESYLIDEVRVYTETHERHAILDGNWNNPATWSYTSGGVACECIPDLLSDTHIDGYTVDITSSAYTHNLTVYNGSTLQWAVNDKDLHLYGDATLDIRTGGKVTERSFTDANLIFRQWNLRNPDNDGEVRAGTTYPGVNVIIDIHEPAGLDAREMAFNAQGTYILQGNGGIDLSEDLDVNYQAAITNHLQGELSIARHLELDYADITFTNHGTINIAQNLVYYHDNASVENNGNIDIAQALHFRYDGSEFTNNGSVVANTLNVGEGAREASNCLFTNNSGSSFRIIGNINLFSSELAIHNHAYLNVGGEVLDAAINGCYFYNHTGGEWLVGGASMDTDVHLLAGEENNIFHYDGSVDQTITVPQDAYWHLYLSNKNTLGYTQSTKTPANTALDIRGDLTMIGTNSGGVRFDVDASNTDINIGGDWWQQETEGATVTYLEGGETVTFDGSADQQVGLRETYYNVALDKPSGQLLLNEGTQINGKATFIEGTVLVGADTALIMGSYATVEQASDASHVIGKMHKYGNRNFTYPLGDGVSYRPIGMSNITFTGADADKPYLRFTAQYHRGAIPDATIRPDSMIHLGPCGYWNLERTDDKVGSESAFVTLHWDEATCPVNVNRLIIARWDGTQWVSEGRGTIVGDAVSGSITTPTPLSAFGLFTLAELSDTPIANSDAASTNEDVPLSINVSTNDTDDDGINSSSVIITRPPQHGTASVDPTTGVIVYTPDLNYFDETTPDSLAYTVEDTKGVLSNEATLKILVVSVNDAPQAEDDAVTIPFATTLQATVLDNDSDIEGDNLTATIVSSPRYGIINFRPDGTYTYTSDIAFSGIDTFTYQACDDGAPSACATATVTITVQPFNYAPQAQADTLISREDVPLEGNVLSNDTDINPEDTLFVETNPIVAPSHGLVTLQTDGRITYVSNPDFFGTDSLAYQICDNGSPSQCDTAWVLIHIAPVNDYPVAIADTFDVTESQPINAQVITNDYDIEGDPFYGVALVNGPTYGEVVLQPNGNFVYTPQEAFVGEDQFSYRICDGQDTTLCSQAIVTLFVQAGPLVIPKGFSPNNDHTNDQWIIEGIQAYPNNAVKIFNRWGNVVYQVSGYDNIAKVWTGEASQGMTVGSGPLPDGTYFYIVDLGDHQAPLSGYLLLKR